MSQTSRELLEDEDYPISLDTPSDQEDSVLSTGQKDFIAGTFAGCAQIISGHPFDTLKVRLQTSGPDARFGGAMDCLRQTMQKEGVAGLFKGMSSPLAGVAAVNAVLFTAYGQASEFLLAHRHQTNQETQAMSPFDGESAELNTSNELTLPEAVVAGSFAGFVNCFVICPVELVKSRLQVQYETVKRPKSLLHPLGHGGSESAQLYKGPWDVIRRVRLESPHGIFGIFKGMAATIYREVPAYAAYFGFYEGFKYVFAYGRYRADNPGQPLRDAPKPEIDYYRNHLNALELFLAGGMGGVGCWLFSYPQDLIKSRLQVEPDHLPSRYRKRFFDGGFWDCGTQIVRAEGFRGLWRGFSPTIIRAFWANAATFLAYEMSMRLIVKYSDRSRFASSPSPSPS